MAGSTARRLADQQRRYRALAAQIADLGFISAGSLTRRLTRCANLNCRCRADPPEPHGPYWQWTTKVNGTTVTRRLDATQAAHYREWIANDRRLRDLVDQMRTIAAEATQLILDQDPNDPPEV